MLRHVRDDNVDRKIAITATAAFLALLLGFGGGSRRWLAGIGPGAVSLRPASVPAAYQAWDQLGPPAVPEVARRSSPLNWGPRATGRPTARSSLAGRGRGPAVPATWARRGGDANGNGVASPNDPEDAIWPSRGTTPPWPAHRPGARGLDRPHARRLQRRPRRGPSPPGYPQYPKRRTTSAVSSPASRTSPTPRSAEIAPAGSASSCDRRAAWLGTPTPGRGRPQRPTPGIGRAAGIVGFDCSGLLLHAVSAASDGRSNSPDPAWPRPGDPTAPRSPATSCARRRHRHRSTATAGASATSSSTSAVVRSSMPARRRRRPHRPAGRLHLCRLDHPEVRMNRVPAPPPRPSSRPLPSHSPDASRPIPSRSHPPPHPT